MHKPKSWKKRTYTWRISNAVTKWRLEVGTATSDWLIAWLITHCCNAMCIRCIAVGIRVNCSAAVTCNVQQASSKSKLCDVHTEGRGLKKIRPSLKNHYDLRTGTTSNFGGTLIVSVCQYVCRNQNLTVSYLENNACKGIQSRVDIVTVFKVCLAFVIYVRPLLGILLHLNSQAWPLSAAGWWYFEEGSGIFVTSLIMSVQRIWAAHDIPAVL